MTELLPDRCCAAGVASKTEASYFIFYPWINRPSVTPKKWTETLEEYIQLPKTHTFKVFQKFWPKNIDLQMSNSEVRRHDLLWEPSGFWGKKGSNLHSALNVQKISVRCGEARSLMAFTWLEPLASRGSRARWAHHSESEQESRDAPRRRVPLETEQRLSSRLF